ncbi:MAG TPA: type I polyketide synthase [Blastocatellia bacterium]|nr:type I polyketide synthase [Blastocatellia bacterium]
MSNLSYPEQAEWPEIAIIGMTGRFPGAKNVEEFWENLRDGVESITFFSDEDLETPSPWINTPNYVKARAVLDGVEYFDAAFFGMSAREAEITDPQQRIFLECAWEALEKAGYQGENHDRSIGVFAGASINSYLFRVISNLHTIKMISDLQVVMGNDKDHLATRVSYKLNLKGPSITVQTACSTSLVATHLACQSLLAGECDIALAGGVSVIVPQKSGYFYHEGGIVSPDGHCRAFDEAAAGTLNGSGVGIVVLKRLSDALADGDYIHAVIKGSAINNDGSSKVGYTAPSVTGQAAAIMEAHSIARAEPETITYIEAHGTGTSLGDPVEVAALTQAFRDRTDKKGFCAIGSVKSNIGHLDAAAGIAGLIKTALSLEHKMIPPSLHFKKPNPKIDFANSPFYVINKLSQWKTNMTPRRAGVSSFGIGGTNAHVVVEEAPETEPSGQSRPWQLILLSAKTVTALEAQSSNLASHLKRHADASLADVAYTLQAGRNRFNHRRAIVCSNAGQAADELERLDPSRVFTCYTEAKDRPAAFMFSGQGTQYPNMARGLYETEAAFREEVDRCSEILAPQLKVDLRRLIYPTEDGAESGAQRLKQTDITQPALFVVEYALARMWMSWGVRPQAMIGHSIGEYVAACLAGVFSLEDALSLVATRGMLMQKMPRGAMLAVPLEPSQAEPLLGKELSIAAINTPSLCVISGPIAAIDELKRQLAQEGLGCWPLETSHAFHSHMMDPVVEPFTAYLKQVKFSAPKIPYVSNLTGTWIKEDEAASPKYWAAHLRHTVRFAEGLAELLKDPDWVLLEVGPGHSLSRLANQCAERDPSQVIGHSLRHPKQRVPDVALLLETLGKLWLAGVAIDWSGFYSNERRRRVRLPAYPFERQRHWIDPPRAEERKATAAAGANGDGANGDGAPVAAAREQTGQPQINLSPATSQDLSYGGQEVSHDGELQNLIELQLAVMSQQLDVWRDNPSAEDLRPASDPDS